MNSFTGDTLVSTSDGDKPIAEIEVGDIVLAYNEETGEIGEYPVTHVWSHEGDESLVTLSIDGEIIIATAGHPFYTTDGEWIAAGDLQIGAEVYSADGTHGTLDALVITDGTAWVYNLTVDEAHTYFVGDGQWLVHNCPDQEEFPFLGDIPEIPRQVDYPAIDPNRPLRSSQYTVIYEVQLDSKILHTNMSREEHFQKANEALYWAMHNDRNLYNALEDAYPGLFQAISPNTKTGVFLGESPTGLGLTWHHRPSTNASPEEGIMQLIPRLHHETGGNVQNTLHPLPRRGGGFQQWR